MHKLPAHQRGLSLISLMIAMLIGAFLIAGLFQMWFQTRQTFGAQSQLAKLQDDERMALTTMANTVQTGGYYPIYLNYSATPPNPLYSLSNSFPVSGSFATVGQVIYGTHDGTTAGESLSVRFIADKTSANPTLDCQGQIEATGTLVVNTYQINNNQLQCSSDGGTTWQSIITSSVYNMTVLYGIDTKGDDTALQYMTADQVQANSDWNKVFSVVVQLTFNNPWYGQPGQTVAQLPLVSRSIAVEQPISTSL
ncbi:MAG TPA: PilW family protein [Dyella sp.]|uniref:PilW family protein n=1 Tax=Dyella sp. TaxID=1869338 RepID=UPI002C84E76D|nr:PilW family protein [Dyella sp.]HTV85704.1 PilW family protein [Dyella sp.]